MQIATIQEITRDLFTRYRQNQEQLILSGYNYWSQALLLRDWSTLRCLFISNCEIRDDSISVIVDKFWPNLTRLSLASNIITENGIKMFNNQQWPILNSLHIGGNNIGDDGVTNLLKNLPSELFFLNLTNCNITEKGIISAINMKVINIKSLQLQDNAIGNKGIKWLVMAHFPYLEQLNIYKCSVGDQGCKNLTKAKWPNLTYLLFSNQINQNRINLSSWSLFQQINTKNLRQFYIPLSSAIYGTSFILMESPRVKINKYETIDINNIQLQRLVKIIIRDRFR